MTCFTAETKGGTIPSCRPEYIIVTSNYSIAECFPEENDYLPLKRRIYEHTIKTRTEPFSWPPEHTIQHTETLNTTNSETQTLSEPGHRPEWFTSDPREPQNPCLKRPREEENGSCASPSGNTRLPQAMTHNQNDTDNNQDNTKNIQQNKDNDTEQPDAYSANPFNL